MLKNTTAIRNLINEYWEAYNTHIPDQRTADIIQRIKAELKNHPHEYYYQRNTKLAEARYWKLKGEVLIWVAYEGRHLGWVYFVVDPEPHHKQGWYTVPNEDVLITADWQPLRHE